MSPRIATHERLGAHEEVRGGSDRAFGIVFAVVFSILGILPALRGGAVRGWLLVAAAMLLVVAVWWPGWLAPLNRVWTWIGRLLHLVATPVVMGFVFYTTVTPIGLLLRLVGKDVLRLRLDRDAATYWIRREPPGPTPDTMRRQF